MSDDTKDTTIDDFDDFDEPIDDHVVELQEDMHNLQDWALEQFNVTSGKCNVLHLKWP